MTTIVEIINSFDQKSQKYEDFLLSLISVDGDLPFDTDEVDTVQSTIIAAVNNRLNQAYTRSKGLRILDKLLPHCSKEVLSRYSLLWLAKATQVLESIHSSSQDVTLACKVIGNLLVQAKEMSDLSKQISMQNVKQLLNIIITFESQNVTAPVCYLIAILLFYYPEICERFQMPLRRIILLHIDSNQDNLINASAKCYTFLVRATERSFKPPPSKLSYTALLFNQVLICNSLHHIMDELFSNLIQLQTVDVSDKLDLPPIPERNIVEFYTIHKQRFINLCYYLASLLRGYDKKNSVSPQHILQVLSRGLTITPLNLKDRTSFKEQMLFLMLPKLHISLLTVLDSLITGFKHQLIPFGSTILALFHKVLQWTETVLEDHTTITGSKAFKTVRISVYKCITSWLMNANSLSGIETVADEYLPSILKDIVPERDRVLLTIQKTQNLSKRALKRLRDSQYEKSAHLGNAAAAKKQLHLDVDVCHHALVVLHNIFFDGSPWLKQTFFKTVQNIVIPILYDCYLSSEQNFYKEHPNCRLQLLRVLRSLQVNPHLLVPSPVQYSTEIFELALNDDHLPAKYEATIALAEIEKIVHPTAPTLQIAQIEEVQTKFISNNEGDEDNTEFVDLQEVNSEPIVDYDLAPSTNKRLKSADAINAEELRQEIQTAKQQTRTSDQTICIEKTLTNEHNKETNDVEMVEGQAAEKKLISIQPTEAGVVCENKNTENEQVNVESSTISDCIKQSEISKNELQDEQTSNENNNAKKNTQAETGGENTLLFDDTLDEEEILGLFKDELKEKS